MPLTPQQMQMLMQMQQGQQQPSMPAPQPGQMPPPAAAGQMNPNVMAFMQQMQQRGGMGQGQPPMGGMPQGMPPQGQPQPGMPQMRPGMPPQGAGAPPMPVPPPQQGMAPQQGMPPQGQQQPPMGNQVNPQIQALFMQMMKQQQMKQAEQGLAAQGRNGDTALAHMTPGEIAVPPEVQTPKVLATLKKEFENKGAHVQQAQVGNPASSTNPSTGLPEYNFMSMFLPAALGIAGSLAAPGIGTALGVNLGSAAAASAIGGGIGSAAGGLATGQTPLQAGLSGLGGAAGSYIGGGGLAGGGGAAAGTPPQSAINAAVQSGNMSALQTAYPNWNPASAGGAVGSASSMGPYQNTMGNLWGNLPGAQQGASINPMAALGGGVGSWLGGQLGAPAKPVGPQYPPGFNTPLTPASQLPSFQQQLGYNTYNGPTPNFTGYNPATNNPGAFNFYGT